MKCTETNTNTNTKYKSKFSPKYSFLPDQESATLKDIVKWTKAEQILQVFIQEFMIEEEQCQLIIDNVLCLLYPWIEQNSVLLFRSPFYRTEVFFLLCCIFVSVYLFCLHNNI